MSARPLRNAKAASVAQPAVQGVRLDRVTARAEAHLAARAVPHHRRRLDERAVGDMA